MTWRLWLVVLAVCTMLGCDAPPRAVVDDSSSVVRILKDNATGVCYAVWGYGVGASGGVVTTLGPVPCNTGGTHAKP